MAFERFSFDGFWDDSDYSLRAYVEEYPTDELIEAVQAELGGYRLPASYIELARLHNGGRVLKDAFPAEGWADEYVAIAGLYGIGRTRRYSLCGEFGSNFMIEQWGYPRLGVCVADTPSAGHEMIMLDYRDCGPDGEPSVVHVDQEQDYTITFLAADYAAFVKALVPHADFSA